jgi:signal transduction histidine kinase
MRRSVWIFLASIFLPSLGLAWMAARSAQDQEVVLEHQQVIISQNITDSLAQNIQAQMDQVRADFVSTTQQLLSANASPQVLAEDFNDKLRASWPMAEIGFAVNLDGEIYSPKPLDGTNARIFRTENDQFLSNRENAEIYSSNSSTGLAQNSRNTQSLFAMKKAQVTVADLDLNAAASTGPSADAQQDSFTRQAPDVEKASEAARAIKEAANQNAMQAAVSQSQSRQSSVTSGNVNLAAPDAVAGHADLKDAQLENQALRAKAVTASATPAGIFDIDEAKAQATGAGGSAPVNLASNAMPGGQVDKGIALEHSAAMATVTQAAPVVAPAANAFAANAPAPQDSDQSAATLSPQATTTPIGGSLAVTAPAAPAANAAPDTDAPMLTAQLATKIPRQVIPQKMLSNDAEALSNTVPEESDFRRAIGSETSGALARFLENKLRLMVWSHPPDTSIVFGAQLDQARLADSLQASFQNPGVLPPFETDSFGERVARPYCLAILDDTGKPVALSQTGFKGDWKHPFVATEIGEALPHWEAALYLTDPTRIGRTARTLQWTIGLIVLVLVAAIVSGGSLVAADVRRQMRLAQQKTDFVSNVSHELKTPLTSIRMFADLLAEKRVPDEQRQSTYLRIISAEAARLTRLINNVLDFARLERGAPPGEHRDCDLVDAVRDVVETCGPHLEAAGIAFQHEIEAESLPIRGDRDALAQIILNLVSNAEKYGGNDVLVRVRRQETSAGALGCVDVLDRGPGIPAEKVRTVFEPFHRLDDSLASGIPGSGLGLTLARRMARSHGGDVTYSARAGGGSCFTLTVPLRPLQ